MDVSGYVHVDSKHVDIYACYITIVFTSPSNWSLTGILFANSRKHSSLAQKQPVFTIDIIYYVPGYIL